MLGDFNTRVGADSKAWPTYLDHHSIDSITENEQTSRAVLSSWTVCAQHILLVQGAPQGLMETHIVLPFISNTHSHHQACGPEQCLHSYSYHSADCNTHYSLVASKVTLTSKNLDLFKTNGQPCFNTCCTADSDRVHKFTDTFRETMKNSTCDIDTVQSKWAHLCNTIYNSSIATSGTRECKDTDWYKVHWEEMEPVD